MGLMASAIERTSLSREHDGLLPRSPPPPLPVDGEGIGGFEDFALAASDARP